MKLKVALIFMIVIASLSLLSCMITSRLINVEISCNDFTDNPHSIRNEYQVEIGDKIALKLCSNQTAGFQWKYEMLGDIAIKEEDHDFEEPVDEDIVGAAGKELWTFEAVKQGTTEVHMEYGQLSQVGEEPEWTYTFTVTVE
jgi:inhibitor of cysteine peptidase